MNERTTTVLMNHDPVDAQTKESAKGKRQGGVSSGPRSVSVDFTEGLVEEQDRLRKPRSSLELLFSFAGHTIVVVLLILLPLMVSHSMDLPELQETVLIAPPPPPPPAARKILKIRPILEAKLYAPRTIPKSIPQFKEEPATPQSASEGVPGGVIGGVPGGTAGGVLGGILGGHDLVPPPPPPPKPPVQRGPLRVGGRIQPPRLIHQVQPDYPILARETQTSGAVVIDCVIDEHGNVVRMKVISGKPLLIKAAFDAVKQWKYAPTLLNGTPIPVEMSVVVHFNLNS